MKVSEMTTWARSLANLSSSQAISHDDEDKSSNAAWKDIYAHLLESNDDYVTKTSTIALTLAMVIGTYEYAIPLPADFYQLRTVEYLGGTTSSQWLPMEKFRLSSRADQGMTPGYRIDNSNLWVKGQDLSSVRIKYYPPPATLTHPDADLQYATAVTPNLFPLITSPGYAAWKNTGLYIYNVQNITEGSIDDNSVGSPVTLYAAGANLSNLLYYKGYLYWLQAGNVCRAPSDLITPFLVGAVTTPVATGTVTSFAVFKDQLYYSIPGFIVRSNLDGTGPTNLATFAGSWMALAGTTVFYIDAAANLKAIGGGTLVTGTALALTSDGTNLYMLDTSRQLHLLTVSGAALGTDTVIRTDVTAIGPWAANRIPLVTGESQQLVAFDARVDTDVTYPANVVLEIMSYQMAVDFKTKVGEDFSKLLERLGHPIGPDGPASGLWARFELSVKRDVYKAERINNSRRGLGGNW